MKRLLWGILANGATLYLIGIFGLMDVSLTIATILVGAAILATVNALIRPVLKAIALPFLMITLGAFTLVINGIILWLATYIVGVLDFSGIVFAITTPIEFIFATVLFSVINFITSLVEPKVKQNHR